MSGIFGADSFISVQDTTVQGNGAAGLSLLGGALKLRSGVSVTGNGTALDPSLPEAGGVFARRADVGVGSGASISNNEGSGLWLQDNTAGDVASAVVNNNVRYGIYLETGSGARVRDVGTVTGNGNDDIKCNGKSTWEARETGATVGSVKGCNQ